MESIEERITPANLNLAVLGDIIEGGSAASFRFTRSDNIDTFSVGFSTTGTASGLDYSYMPMVMFTAGGSLTADLAITPSNDSNVEGTETIIVTLVANSPYYTDTGSATMKLFDDDTVRVSVAKQGLDPFEGENGTFRISRTGSTSGNLTVDFTTGGSATSGTDYTSIGKSATITSGNSYVDVNVAALRDNVVENGNESVSILITDNGTTYSAFGDSAFVALAIIDDPQIINVRADMVVEAGATGGFTFTRSGGDISKASTVSYTLGGTADVDDDFVELSGSIEFPAGVDTFFVPVEAIGDNILDVDETVIATIDGGGTDYILGDDDDGTVVIEEQPVTVSVSRNADGVENGTNPSFTFTRAGDLTEELVVSYTVSGTASSASSADYTALSGSLTFDENEDTVVVTATLTNDSTSETTETISVLIDEDEDYLLANALATVFVTDDDATSNEVYWVSTGSTDWDESSNWSSKAVPDEDDIVHFWSSKSKVDCTNLGEGKSLLEFAGLRIEDSYPGTITLDAPLQTGMFNLASASATINQPHADEDIVVTGSFIWTDGKLNTVDSGANVIFEGLSVGLIDPPDSSSIATSSTVSVAEGAVLDIFPGEVKFTGGTGLLLEGQARLMTSKSVEVKLNDETGLDAVALRIESKGTMTISRKDQTQVAAGATEFPIFNKGKITLGSGIRWSVKGQLYENGPSIEQESGQLTIVSGSVLVSEHGTVVLGGNVGALIQTNGDRATHNGTLTIDTPVTNGLATVSPAADTYGTFKVIGEAIWREGRFLFDIDGKDESKVSRLEATDLIRVERSLVALRPVFKEGTAGAGGNNRSWRIVVSPTGIKNLNGTGNELPPADIGLDNEPYVAEADNDAVSTWWKLRRTPQVD